MKKYGEMNVNKYREMHDSRLHKGLRVLRREGPIIFLYRLFHYLKRLGMVIITPLVVRYSSPSYFTFQGKKIRYVLHKQSLAWNNERSLEVPLVMEYIRNGSRNMLEVGAVLRHYYPMLSGDVLDKFEPGEGIIHDDASTFRPSRKYDLIVSISTLEHVGFDDDAKDHHGTWKAIYNLQKNCLAKGGTMVITLPLRYNKAVDEAVFKKEYGFSEQYFFRRVSWRNTWKQISPDAAQKASYSFDHANFIVVGIVKG